MTSITSPVTRSSSLATLVLPFALCGLTPAATLTYDANTSTSGAQDGAGSGWNTSATNFWNGSGNVSWPNTSVDEAVFGAGGGAAGTVTLGSVTTNKITFNAASSGSYTLTGGTITLSGSSPTITANADAAIASPITGSTGLTKAGTGILTLTGNNPYTGGTTVSAGTLQIGNGTTNGLPGTGTYAIAAGATLRLNYNASGAALPAWANYTGAGTIALKTLKNFDFGWGNLALPAGFTGKLLIENGRPNLNTGGVGLGGTTAVEVRQGGHLGMWNGGTHTANFVIAGTGYGESGFEGALRFGNTGVTTTLNGTFALSADATIGASGGTGIIAQPITEINAGTNLRLGTSGMTGTVEVRGANTYTGTTTVSFGTLRLAHSQALQFSTLTTGGVVFSSTVVSNAFTLGGLSGSGTLTLANNAPTPAAITLSVGNNNANTSHSGTITGIGNLVKVGNGATRLTGVTSYTGTTAVNTGTLQVPTGTATTGACTVADGATLAVAGASAQSWRCTSLTAGTSTGATLEFPVMTATTAAPILVTTALNTAGTVTLKVPGPFTVGTFPLIKYPPLGTIGGAGFAAFTLPPLPQGVAATLVNDNTTGTISLNVTTANSLTWQGSPSSTWDLATSTAWTLGGLPDVFQNGSMALFDDTATGSTSVAVSGSVAPLSVSVNNSTLNYTFSGSGAISGSTVLVKTGSGTLTVTNANTYTGTTTVNGGTLKIGDGTTDGTLASPIANNASVVFDNAGATTYGGALSGGGAGVTITKQGPGTLTLTGSNSFTGSTAVNAGTLRLGNGVTNANYTAGTYTIPSTGRLLIDNATAVSAATWGPKLSGTGLVELNTAQVVNGSANWGPNLSTANPIPAGFTGTLQINCGRIDLSPTGVGGMTKVVIKDGSQFLAWAGSYPATLGIDIAGNGWGEVGQPGALRIAGATVGTWAGPINLTANAGILSQSGGSVFTLTGSITGAYECNFIRNGNIVVAPSAAVRNSYGSTRISSSGGTGFVSAGNANAFSPGALVMDGGALYLNGFSFDFANLSGTTGEIRNNHATDPVTLTVGATGDTTYAGSLINGGAGKLSLAKTGTGALRLTGSVTYTGDTTVSGGLLQVPAPTTTVIGGICSVAGSSQLAVTGAAASIWHSDQMNLAAGSALTIRNFYSNPAVAPVEVDTTMTTAGTVTVNVPAGSFETGVFPLIYYPVGTGISGSGYSALTLGTLPRGVNATLQDDTGNSAVNLNITAVNPLKWKGNVSGAWDIATTQNWTLASVAENYLEGDMVLFDDTATNFAVTLAGNVTPALVNFDNTANNYTLSGTGAITGSTKLTKAGTGKLTISGSHSYTGGTFVTGGTLELPDGATLTGGITNDANVSFDIAATQAMPAGITGTGSVTKSGLGTLTIASAQTYAGGTTVNGGMVKMSGANNGSSSAGPGTLTINSGATVEANSHNVLGNSTGAHLSPLVINGGSFLNDQYLHLNSLTMTGGSFGIRAGVTQVDGLDLRVRNSALPAVTTLANATPATVSSKITLRDATTVTVADGAAASDLVLSGAIVGSVALTKEGPGTLELATGAAGSYTGATNVNAGTLRLNGGSLGNTATSIASGATLTGVGTITGTVNVQTGSFIAPGNNGTGTLATGAGTLAGTYTCELDGANADRINVTGNLNVNGATIAFSTINPPTAASYIIATYTGTLSGNPAAVTGIPAGYTLDVVTSGQIRLVAGYSAWAATMGLDGTPGKENGLTADPDKDGIDNLTEFYLDGNPLASSQAILPVSSLDATHLTLTFKRRDDAELDVTTQTIQYGSTLTGWTTVTLGAASATDGNGVAITIVENGTAADDITVKIPRTLSPISLFARLRVIK